MNAKEADILRKHLLAEMKHEDESLLKVVAAVPASKLGWKPTKEMSKSAGDLAWHCAAPATFFFSCVDGNMTPSGKRTAKTKAKLLADIREMQAYFTKRLTEMSAADLAKETAFFDEKHAAVRVLGWHKSHLIHHRGQLSLYLRLMGAKVPGVYGPSADEEQHPA